MSSEHQLASPAFNKVTLRVDKIYYQGGKFIIEAMLDDKNKLFSTVKLNGKIIDPVITHSDIQKRCILEFLMEE